MTTVINQVLVKLSSVLLLSLLDLGGPERLVNNVHHLAGFVVLFLLGIAVELLHVDDTRQLLSGLGIPALIVGQQKLLIALLLAQQKLLVLSGGRGGIGLERTAHFGVEFALLLGAVAKAEPRAVCWTGPADGVNGARFHDERTLDDLSLGIATGREEWLGWRRRPILIAV